MHPWRLNAFNFNAPSRGAVRTNAQVGEYDRVFERYRVAGDLPISGDHDKAGVRQMVAGLSAMTAGPVTFTPVGFVAEGDRVSVEAESAADLKNGKHYSNKYHLIFEFDGDLISRVREYTDTKKVFDTLFG